MRSISLSTRQAQRKRLRGRGYVQIKDFFDVGSVESFHKLSNAMSRQARSILRSATEAGESLSERARMRTEELVVVTEFANPDQVCRYEFMMGSSAEFRHFVTTHIQPACSDLLGEELTPFKDKTNEKLPGGGAFRPHQDFAAYQCFAPRYYVTALLSVDRATLGNGCVHFATNLTDVVLRNPQVVADTVGRHSLLRYSVGGQYHGDISSDIVKQLDWEPVECGLTDLVVFDSFVPHFSPVNASMKARRAIFVTFNLASEGSLYDRYYAAKRLNYDDPSFHVSTPTSHTCSGKKLERP